VGLCSDALIWNLANILITNNGYGLEISANTYCWSAIQHFLPFNVIILQFYSQFSHCYHKKCKIRVVYWTVLCLHPYLVFLLLAVLLSLHIVNFFTFVYFASLFLQYFAALNLSSLTGKLDATFGAHWDIYLMSLLTGLVVLLLVWRRRQ